MKYTLRTLVIATIVISALIGMNFQGREREIIVDDSGLIYPYAIDVIYGFPFKCVIVRKGEYRETLGITLIHYAIAANITLYALVAITSVVLFRRHSSPKNARD